MLWQYRTILFEFTKDGLLGDKYVDDEEMERTLNDQGKKGWELVNVTLLQDGLLAFLKRPGEKGEGPVVVAMTDPPEQRPAAAGSRQSITAEQIQEEEREHIRGLEQQRKSTMQKQEIDLIGDIRIS